MITENATSHPLPRLKLDIQIIGQWKIHHTPIYIIIRTAGMQEFEWTKITMLFHVTSPSVENYIEWY